MRKYTKLFGNIFEERRGHGLRHKQIFNIAKESNNKIDQHTTVNYCNLFLSEGKIIKIKEKPNTQRKFIYGIPNIREDETRYFIIDGEEFEITDDLVVGVDNVQ